MLSVEAGSLTKLIGEKLKKRKSSIGKAPKPDVKRVLPRETPGLRLLAIQLSRQMIQDGYTRLERGEYPVPTPRQVNKPSFTEYHLRDFVVRGIKVLLEEANYNDVSRYMPLIKEFEKLGMKLPYIPPSSNIFTRTQ